MTIYDFHFRVRVDDAPDYYYKGIQTDVIDPDAKDPGNPSAVHHDYTILKFRENEPTATASGLDITTNVGSAIVDDVTSITADPDDTKYCLVSVVRDDTSGLLEIQVLEKTLGNYADTPAGKTLECDIKEFSLVAAGTVLVEV